MSSSCLGFIQRATTQSEKYWMYFAQTVFPVERIQFNVNNLCEVTELVISQRRHSHPKPPFAEDHRKPPAPNTAPKQRRALILPHKSTFYSCLVAVSLERHSCHTQAPEELPWWGHLWLNGEEITRKCILSLSASSEAIREEKQRDIELTPGRFWKVLARAQWAVAWFEAQPESQGDTASAPTWHGKCQTPQNPFITLSLNPSWVQNPQELRAVMLLSSSPGRKWERWSKSSVTKAGCRVQLKHWGCCTQREELWTILGFSPLSFPYIYADCTSTGPLVFRNISPRTAFCTWETANSRLIQQNQEEHWYKNNF